MKRACFLGSSLGTLNWLKSYKLHVILHSKTGNGTTLRHSKLAMAPNQDTQDKAMAPDSVTPI